MKKKKVHKGREKHAYHKSIASWIAPEYIKPQKTFIWFTGAGIAAVLLIIYGIRNEAWTFAAAVMAAALAYFAYHRRKPGRVKVVISKMGIQLGKHKIPYSSMRAFWIVYHPPFIKTLNIRTTGTFIPDVTIQLDDQDPVEVREYLVKQIPEWEGKQENFVDSLTRFLKL